MVRSGETERLWMTSRNHPNAAGLPDQFELEHEEMYSEPFGVLEPITERGSCLHQDGEEGFK